MQVHLRMVDLDKLMLCTSPWPSHKHPRNGLERHETTQKQTTPKRSGRVGPKQLRNGLGEPEDNPKQKAPKPPLKCFGNPAGNSSKMVWESPNMFCKKQPKNGPKDSPETVLESHQAWSEQPRNCLRETQSQPEHQTGLEQDKTKTVGQNFVQKSNQNSCQN